MTGHDPDDPRYTTVHGGVQIPQTHDPQTSTSRPTPTGQRDVGPSVAPAGEEPRGTHDPLCPRNAVTPPERETVYVVKRVQTAQCACAFIACVREDERGKNVDLQIVYDNAYRWGQRDERERIRAGVTGLAPSWAVKFYVLRPSNGEWIGCNGAHEEVDVLSVIDALRGQEAGE